MGKRILVISPTATHPANSGNRVRIIRMVEALTSLGHDVHLLVSPRESNDPAAMRAWLGDRLHLATYHWPRRKESGVGKLMRWARQVVDREARYLWGIDDWYDPHLDAEIDRLHAIHAFETVIVVYVFFSKALERFGPEVLKAIDAQDRFTLRHRNYLKAGMPPVWFSTTQSEEARGLDRADLVLAIQDEEREYLSRICHGEVITFGHLVHVEPQFDPNRSRSGFNILFVGSSNHINVAGIQAFAREEWPQLRRRIPEARLLLAGGVCNSDVGGEGIELLGFVEDLRSVYRQADVVINPVPQGTGLNIKSIEALGYGFPLVTSPSGARGLEAAFDRALIVAATPEDTVTALERVRNEPQFARSLSTAAVAFARQWNVAVMAQLTAKLA